jgi:hypothetical protein
MAATGNSWSCLSMDRDKINSLHIKPYMDASCLVSVHLAMQFQRSRLFRNQQKKDWQRDTLKMKLPK